MVLTAALPSALWLALPAVGLLLLFRLLRAKRRRVVAGSLLVWKRLAALPIPARPKRVVLDLAFCLQAAALLALVTALGGVAFGFGNSHSRTVLIVLDNGPLSRVRDANGRVAFDAVKVAAKAVLDRLAADDRVMIAQAAPSPRVISAVPIPPVEARALIDAIVPALSGPDEASIMLFAADRARTVNSSAHIVVSLSAKPVDAISESLTWIGVKSATSFGNVGIVEAGSIRANGGAHVLIRVANFSDQAADGKVVLEALIAGTATVLEEQAVALGARAERAVGFRVGADHVGALRVSWRGIADALPEDDTVVLAAREDHAPRVRFHAPHAALEKLFRLALNALFVPSDAKQAESADVDLDVYVGSVPERFPDDCRAALLVAPERGYQSHFDVGDRLISWPTVQRGDESALTSGVASGGNAAIAIPKAYEILRTGDFATLLRDSESGRVLAARFVDEKTRPVYVLAFSPGDGLAADRALDPALAAMLVRMGLEASRSGSPYVRASAAELERSANQALALDWRPGLAGLPPMGSGVLDERVSNFLATKRNNATDEISISNATRGGSADGIELTPWLCVAALILAMAEVFVSREN